MRSIEARIGKSVSAACIGAMLGGAATAHATPAGLPFAPHRAVYEMQLAQTEAGKNIAGVEGRMVFDINGSACAGYTLENRMVTRIVDAEGVEVVSDIRSSTWEDGEGKQFRFTSTQYMNDQLTDNLKGKAVRQPPDRIQVMLETPRETELRIKKNAQFPTQFSFKILEAAQQGKRILQANVYDGTETGDKLFETTTFIGEPIAPGEDMPAETPGHERLKDLRSWPVSISYYEAGAANEGVPNYQLSFRLYENGVSRKLKIDYGSFALSGQLSSLEFHSAEPCPQKPG